MSVRSNAARCTLLLLSMMPVRMGAAQTSQPLLPHAGLPSLKTVSTTEYRAHLEALRGIVLACARNASECDPVSVGDDNYVNPEKAPAYVERFGWLRDLLEDHADPTHEKRTALLPHADQRLVEQIAEIDAPLAAAPVVSRQVQSARAAVLSRKEFRTASGYSLGDRLAAWFSELLNRMFGGVSSLGRMAPWLGTAVQWGTLLIAATLLLLWAYRALDRQRVTIGRLRSDSENAEQQAESRLWAARARERAERSEWREAVHALYWASIVALEDRRTLRRSGTRTPREALGLIDPASHLREPLRAQTGDFERIWYGLQPAGSMDYESALSYYHALQAGSSRTGGS